MDAAPAVVLQSLAMASQSNAYMHSQRLSGFPVGTTHLVASAVLDAQPEELGSCSAGILLLSHGDAETRPAFGRGALVQTELFGNFIEIDLARVRMESNDRPGKTY